MAILFWVMTAGAAVVWTGVVALSLYASRWKHKIHSEPGAGRLIVWGGVALPVVTLAALLAYAMWLMPSLRPFAASEQARLRIDVEASQFWWRVIYHTDDGSQVVSANEIRLPVGERVEFALTSADMIHSFWIPALGGKMDLIPGRTNRLSLRATKAGTYRGQCAEFCGVSHALMAFPAVAMEAADFDAWLRKRRNASSGVEAQAGGRAIFMREGCGTCHRVEGTTAQGKAGPDLSHIGSRLTIGAGLLDNDPATMVRFIRHPASLKAGSKMPAYLHLPTEEVDAIASWLRALQ